MKLMKYSDKLARRFRKHNLNRLKYSTFKDSFESLILNNTVISKNHLTPELKLRLITPDCSIYHSKASESVFPCDPFWGIYWPGGQALGRYILDNGPLFFQKNVLDIGSGSGACALAAAKVGAMNVLANDIDPVSIAAIHLNAKLNNLRLYTSDINLLGMNIDNSEILTDSKSIQLKWDVVLIGDLFYDSEFSYKLFYWLCELAKKEKLVLLGDPGRHALNELDLHKCCCYLIKIAEYPLCDNEHHGFSNASVFKVQLKS